MGLYKSKVEYKNQVHRDISKSILNNLFGRSVDLVLKDTSIPWWIPWLEQGNYCATYSCSTIELYSRTYIIPV